MTNINLDELQKSVLVLISKFKERAGTSIDLKNDYYWDIDAKELYNPYQEPRDFALWQISFDWEHLKKINPDEAIPYDFEKVANILKALSNEYPIVF